MSRQLVITCVEDKLQNPYFVVSFENENGKSIVKYLTYNQLLRMLDSSYIEEKVYVSPGQLGEGYIDSNICTDGGGSVRIYVPAQPRVMLLRIPNQKLPKAFKIPMPPMLFQVRFGGKRLQGHCCIVKGSFDEVKDQYYGKTLVGYIYPFGNVANDGQICMGNINYEVQAAIDASKYVDAFFDGITSSDYLTASRVKSGKLQMELLSLLEGKKNFPYEELLKLPVTVNESLCLPYGMETARVTKL